MAKRTVRKMLHIEAEPVVLMPDPRPRHRPVTEIRKDMRSAYGEALVLLQRELDAAVAAQEGR